MHWTAARCRYAHICDDRGSLPVTTETSITIPMSIRRYRARRSSMSGVGVGSGRDDGPGVGIADGQCPEVVARRVVQNVDRRAFPS